MRKFLLFVGIVLLFLAGLYEWKQRHAAGRAPEKYTPAMGAKLDLKDVQVLAAADQEFTKLVEAVVPSVVSITTSKRVRVNPYLIDPFEQFFGMQRRGVPRDLVQNALGSGVIVSKEGYIITNNHVIANVDEIKVQLTDGRVESAQVIGADEQTDIAVLKINAPNLAPLPFGNSDEVKVGQLGIAVGNPFGLQETVTKGIISARGRRSADDSGGELFQTDTAINPGNSGGPLVNIRGEIIGINSSIASGTGGWQGIGFAVPSNVARRALESVLKHGRVVRGYLGVVIQELTPELAAQFGVPDAHGALVTECAPDSPAEKAGIKGGDIIQKFNGKKIAGIRDLRSRVAELEVGSKAELGILRDKKEMNLAVEVAEQTRDSFAARSSAPSALGRGSQKASVLAGVSVAEIPLQHRQVLPENVRGVMITQIDPDSGVAQVLRPGDVIEEINRQPVNSVADYEKLVAAMKPDERQMLSICRGRSRSFVVISPG
jgi:serine protease Do